MKQHNLKSVLSYIIVATLILISLDAVAQWPDTDIYLFEIRKSKKGYTLENKQKINARAGYNNQPYFTPDNRYLYYVASIDTTNTEIYRYDIEKKKNKRLTRTKECEYSPKLTPDLEHLSCVRVERDKVTQRLYTYTLKGKKPKMVEPELKNIGYYDWILPHEFLSFELPEPFQLTRHNIITKRVDTIATHVGRNFYAQRAKGKIWYVDKQDSTKWYIRSVNMQSITKKSTMTSDILTIETLPNEEDYTIMMDGSILMGHEGILYRKPNPTKFPDASWEPLADLKPLGIERFYRLAISASNMQIAIVAYKGKKP